MNTNKISKIMNKEYSKEKVFDYWILNTKKVFWILFKILSIRVIPSSGYDQICIYNFKPFVPYGPSMTKKYLSETELVTVL